MTTTAPPPTSLAEPRDLGLTGRSLTKELDLTVEQWQGLLDLAVHVKRVRRERHRRREPQHLAGMSFALLVAGSSTRTRCAFEVAAHDQGGHVTHVEAAGSRLGHHESVRDTGRVLGRTFDGIECRGHAQGDVELLAEVSGVPVWNGLSDHWHPTQSLGDVLTMSEHAGKPLDAVSVAYVGDARAPVARSLLVAGAMSGLEVRMVAPPGLAVPHDVRDEAGRVAVTTGARLSHTDDVREGVRGVDFVYTDDWLAAGETGATGADRAERLALLRPYRVDAALMAATGNPGVRLLHCLPARHDDRSEVGAQALAAVPGETCLEVTDEVFESPASVVFDQAENRLHAVKAVMVATAGR